MCLEISERYEIQFIEIGYEKDHVHFLVQSVPSYSVSKMVTILKSITASFKYPQKLKQCFWVVVFGLVIIMLTLLDNIQMKGDMCLCRESRNGKGIQENTSRVASVIFIS